MKFKFLNVVAVSLLLSFSLMSNLANAGLIIIDASERGTYTSTGGSGSGGSGTSTGNYIVGQSQNKHNFFNFDLSALSGKSVLSVDFLISNTYGSGNSSYDFLLYDFTGAIDSLINMSGGVSAWADLGNGQVFGQKQLSSLNVGNTIETISFNALGLNAVSNNVGNDFAFGGAIGTTNFLFGSTLGSQYKTQLRINFEDAPSVPEPSTLVIFALGMIGLASRRFKKQS